MNYAHPWLFIAVVSGLSVAGVLVWEYLTRRERRKRLSGRRDLPLETVYTEFFAAYRLPKELVLDLWKEVATSFGMPPGLLRPSDRFDKELGPVKGLEFDDDIIVLEQRAKMRLHKLAVKVDLSKIETVRDYVELFCKLEQNACPK